MTHVDDSLVARRDNVRQSFEFRAEGGDDHSMPWTKVEVVEPPQLSSLTIVTHPPAYTACPHAGRAVERSRRHRSWGKPVYAGDASQS